MLLRNDLFPRFVPDLIYIEKNYLQAFLLLNVEYLSSCDIFWLKSVFFYSSRTKTKDKHNAEKTPVFCRRAAAVLEKRVPRKTCG